MRGSAIGLALLACLCLPASAELLAYYPFDSDFSDASGNGNHLTVGAGTPTITHTAGELVVGGGALDIHSLISTQEFLNLTTPISFGASDAWSVAFWARHRPGNDGRAGMIVGDLTGSNFIWIPRDGVIGGLRFRNGSSQNADYTSPPAGVEPAGVYHHWAVVADGTGMIEVFYDNASLGAITVATAFSITSVAQAFNQATQSMDGQIDDLRIYDEAITAAKISELSGGSPEPDTTAPTLSGSDLVDNRGGGPVAANTAVIYNITFSEAMDAATMDADDFGNAGSAPIRIGAISASSPSVYNVAVTPTAPGSLQLALVAGAVLTDLAGNPLDTGSPILDDTVITVEASVDPPAETPVRRLLVFLIGGQSNADGRGDPAALPASPIDLQQPQEDVDFYDGAPLTTLRPRALFGPEITLGRRLADSIANRPGSRVAIIKYGVGGTSLKTDWKAGGDATTAGDGPRYVTFQQVVGNGLAALAAAYPDAAISIDGMLWVQGERDARNLDHGEYAANLTSFIADVRDTYGDALPFAVMRLSSGQTNLPAAGLDGVRDAQSAVAATDPQAPLIDSDSFGLQSDALHFDALGQQQLGDATAAELLALFPFTTQPALEWLGDGDIGIILDDAFPGFLYTLQTNLTLQPDRWVDVGSRTATSPRVAFAFTPPAGENRRFFRVRRSPAP